MEGKSNHPKEPQRLHNRLLLFLRTRRHPRALRLGFVVAHPLDDTALPLYLGDIQRRNLQLVMLPAIRLDFLIGGLLLGGGDVQLVQVQVDLDMLLDM